MPYKKNQFEQFDVNTKFSPQLKKKIEELREEKSALEDVCRRYFDSHPEAKIPDFQSGIDKGIGSIKKDFDERNFGDYVSVLVEPEWSLKEKEEYMEDFLEKFYSSKEERKKLLDKFYDKFDSFDTANYDLTCITGDGKDKGERGADGLTSSERDLLSYYRISKAEQAVRTTRYGFRDYFQERYNTVEKEIEFRTKEQELRSPSVSISTLFRGNGFEYTKLQPRDEVEFDEGEEYSGVGVGIMFDVCEKQKKLISGEIEPEACDGIFNLHASEPEYISQLNTLSTNMVNTSENTSLGENIAQVYNFKDIDHIYIDGIRASEFVEPFMEGEKNKTSVVDRFITSGEHRVETISFGISKEGNITPIVNTINPYDNEFYKADPGREARIERIRDDMNTRLGPNKKFYDVLDASCFSMNNDLFDEETKKFRNKEVPPQALSYDEKIKKLKNELEAIDTWYHRNSPEFKDMLSALEDPSNSDKLLKAADAYINKYVKEDKTFKRQTDLGNARMSKIMEIKCAVKDNEKEKKEKSLEEISKRKEKRQEMNKDHTNIKVMIRESDKKEKDWGKTRMIERTLEKSVPQLNGPS